MSSGLVICSICGHEVHQVRPGNAGWVHCDVQTPRCVGAESVYPLDRSEIVGKFCGKDAPVVVPDNKLRLRCRKCGKRRGEPTGEYSGSNGQIRAHEVFLVPPEDDMIMLADDERHLLERADEINKEIAASQRAIANIKKKRNLFKPLAPADEEALTRAHMGIRRSQDELKLIAARFSGVSESQLREQEKRERDTVSADYAHAVRQERYRDYLKSNHWQQARRAALDRAGNHCQLCNSGHNLNVHHKTYDRIGAERADDLVVLCKDCHSKFHDRLAE